MKERILRNWNPMRFLRLFSGVAAMIYGIFQPETLMIMAGSFLMLAAVFDYGCGGSTGCPVSFNSKQKEK